VADQEGWLRMECRRLYLFVTDPQRPSPIAEDLEKRQLLWRSLLESLLVRAKARTEQSSMLPRCAVI
jgi:hypothetical protein